MDLAFLRKYKSLMAIIMILLFAVVLRMMWLKLTLNADEGELGYDAMIWLRGESPYTVRYSEKPPLLYLVYMTSMLLFGNTIIPVRIFNDVIFFISILAFYLLVKNWYGKKVGLVASFVYVFFLNAPVFWGPYAVAIHLSIPFTVFSVLMCTRYVETEKVAFLIASGTFLSIAGLLRVNSFVTVIVLFLILILGKQKSVIESPTSFLNSLTGRILVLIVSMLFPVLLISASFWAYGILDRVIYDVVVRQFTEVVPMVLNWNPPFGWQFLGLIEGLPILVFTILGCIACFFTRSRYNVYAISWLLIQLPLVVLGAHDFYHIAVIAPAASILSAFALVLPIEQSDKTKQTLSLSSMRKHRIRGIFIFTFFIFLLLPSLYFQALQFPSGTIKWEFIDWEYSTVGSYDQVMELTRYLESLNVTDGKVLIQDWVPYVYWLTGIEAPTIHLNTVQLGIGIPPDDYERLFAEVRKKEIPYVVVYSERPEGADPITDFVRKEYFPLNHIGGMDIYGATYPIEEDVSFSFIARLSDARKYALLPDGEQKPLGELDDTVVAVVMPRVERLTVNNETQFAIRQHPLMINSNITYSSVQIPSNATLEFSTAIDPAAWTESGDGVTFEIIIKNNGQSSKIFSQYIDPKKNEEDRRWHYYRVPLEDYSNKSIDISFITDPGPAGDSRYDWAYWGNPLIRQGK